MPVPVGVVVDLEAGLGVVLEESEGPVGGVVDIFLFGWGSEEVCMYWPGLA